MNKCKDCKWHLKWDDDWGECELTWAYEGDADHPAAQAIAWADGATALLLVAPDFGCVSWEAKGDA